ncbi:MAG TPA: PQQ-binding-like beta-propeller repeat protein, partial [Gemmataceae bacterium]|nr:PQQ-binding-like beta-propeller repeat protein [Gemmataceae bacterium]
LPNVWLYSLQGFTVVLMTVTAIGLCWAGRRYRRIAAEDASVTDTPAKGELYALLGLTAAVGLIAASSRFFGPWRTALEMPMREFTFIAISLLFATLYAAYRAATRAADGPSPTVRLSLSGELVGLGVLFLCGLLAVTTGKGTNYASGTTTGDADEIGPRFVSVKTFAVPDADQVMSAVTVSGDKLYFGASKQAGFSVGGFAFCLDRNTGALVWKFDNGNTLKPVFCTPTVADGRVYFGEGLHTDSGCKLYCVDAATGKPAWEKPFETGSHTEGTPRVFDGKVAFSAGDDGLFAADAKTGAKLWHFQGTEQKLHIDTPPTVVGNRLFAGSGYTTYAAVCLDATTGKEVWKQPVPFRSFAAPLAMGKFVYYGLGTGNLAQDTEGDEKEPGGAVVCLNADDGKEVWKYDLTRSAHAGLAADAFSIYATSRDGCVHCLERATGKLRWKTGIGGAVTSGAAVAVAGGLPVAVYAVSREGRVVCLNPQSGKVVWEKQLPGFTWDGQDANGVFGTPSVVADGTKRTIYVGAMTVAENTRKKTCAVFRFDDEIPE